MSDNGEKEIQCLRYDYLHTYYVQNEQNSDWIKELWLGEPYNICVNYGRDGYDNKWYLYKSDKPRYEPSSSMFWKYDSICEQIRVPKTIVNQWMDLYDQQNKLYELTKNINSSTYNLVNIPFGK